VEKAMRHKAFESDEVNNIIQALGVRFGLGNRLGLNLGLGVPLFMSIDKEFGVLGGVRCYLGIDF